MNDYYIETLEVIKEETNNEGETTYYIKGRLSKNGGCWEKCVFIYNGNMESTPNGK